MNRWQYFVVIFLIIIITSIFWIAVLSNRNINIPSNSITQDPYKVEFENLRYFCVMDYCETPQRAGGHKPYKSLSEKEAEMKLFCDDLQTEFSFNCGLNTDFWGDYCLDMNERIVMFCYGLRESKE